MNYLLLPPSMPFLLLVESLILMHVNSHQLRCETGHWKRPKEAWEERVCTFCTFEKVETKKHFILKCRAFKDIKDIKDSYVNILTTSSWVNLFNEGPW